jgi:hypothetical protein
MRNRHFVDLFAKHENFSICVQETPVCALKLAPPFLTLAQQNLGGYVVLSANH